MPDSVSPLHAYASANVAAASVRHSDSRASLQSTASVTVNDGQVGDELDVVPHDLLQSLYLGRLGSGSLRTASPPQSGRNSPTHQRDDSSLSETWKPSVVADWPKSFSFTSTQRFPAVKKLPSKQRKRILVTGGAGFVGSHLVDRLMCSGHDVTVLDNFFSGAKSAIAHWIGHPNFELVRADVVEPFMVECDEIYHLACPASPKAYQHNPVKTLKTNFMGTMNMLGLAKRVKARFLLSSTSEIYGSPTEHPQKETYWGNVNSVGPRACYDEGKRVAEALTYGYHRQDGVDVRVARIFNCFGPRMNSSDGRLVSNFAVAALRGDPIEIYGDGEQTRSLMYVQDLVTGLIALMGSDFTEPVNIGSENESTVAGWALVVRNTVEEMREKGEIAQSVEGGTVVEGKTRRSELVFTPAVIDDPPRRKPDITRAREVLGWEPKWTVKSGIEETIKYFASEEEDL